MESQDYEKIDGIVAKDDRYHREAYFFTLEAFNYTLAAQARQGHRGHLHAKQVCAGIREFAERQFGYLTKTVFSQWGVTKTEDFGEIIYAMIDSGLLTRHDDDRIEDFSQGYDFDEVFEQSLIYE